jgi:hypothetical protein
MSTVAETSYVKLPPIFTVRRHPFAMWHTVCNTKRTNFLARTVDGAGSELPSARRKARRSRNTTDSIAFSSSQRRGHAVGAGRYRTPRKACELETGTAQVPLFEAPKEALKERWQSRKPIGIQEVAKSPFRLEPHSIRGLKLTLPFKSRRVIAFVARTKHGPPVLFCYSKIEHSLQNQPHSGGV